MQDLRQNGGFAENSLELPLSGWSYVGKSREELPPSYKICEWGLLRAALRAQGCVVTPEGVIAMWSRLSWSPSEVRT